MTSPDLTGAVSGLVGQVAHWTPSRWAASAPSGPVSRAAIMHDLVQRLADLEAATTGRPPLAVPRLDNDLVLPDQVRVVARDLVAAGPEPDTLAEATQAVLDARRALTEQS